jgi:hypothetical protein
MESRFSCRASNCQKLDLANVDSSGMRAPGAMTSRSDALARHFRNQDASEPGPLYRLPSRFDELPVAAVASIAITRTRCVCGSRTPQEGGPRRNALTSRPHDRTCGESRAPAVRGPPSRAGARRGAFGRPLNLPELAEITQLHAGVSSSASSQLAAVAGMSAILRGEESPVRGTIFRRSAPMSWCDT